MRAPENIVEIRLSEKKRGRKCARATDLFRAEGALSIESPENIVGNRSVLKKKNEEFHYGLQKTS